MSCPSEITTDGCRSAALEAMSGKAALDRTHEDWHDTLQAADEAGASLAMRKEKRGYTRAA